MKSNNISLAEQILRISNKLIFLEKKSLLKHGDLKLYPSEIHLINVIAEGHDINASKMATKLGVTKGAVSQTLARLEKKGVLNKTKDSQNKNELTVYFTPLGKNVLEEHRKLRATFHEQYVKYFSDIPEKEKVIIMSFLKKMEEFFDFLK
ncbi:MAG: MarR family transcriptional regulator [Desulfobacteraceae bacterium]|nr:MarR family transcriptional regulator [Desulfobacteraceae bacterium]